jgi:antirestriction protein
MSRKAREGDGDCVTDFALPYDYDETDHQRDELKRLKRMEGGRKMAAEWKADNEGNPDEKDTTWRKHDGGYQATVKWDDGGEKRYRWDVLDTDDRTVDSGHSDSIEDAKNDADDALEEHLKAHEKESAAFRVAQDIDELTDAADDLMDGDPDGVPAGEIAKAEWVASRMAERHMARKIDDDVRHHLAGMGCTVGLIACAKLTEKKAYAEYKAEAVKSAKHVGNRKPRLKTKEARYKAWAARKVAFGGDVAIFIGAVSNPTNGDWLSLPASDSEIDEAIERAQTGPDGEFYEEVMIADTDGLGNSVGEYDDIRKVNEWVEAVEDAGLDEDLLEALLDEYDLEYVADNIDSVDYWNDVDDEKDLGYRIIEELGWDGISDDDKQMYFDYEGFGRDIVINDGYTIDNGFAFRVASRTALGNDIHARMLVALAEKNVREKVGEKVKTKVKTCGKMAAARKTKRKAASMTKKTASLFEEIERSGVPDSDISHWNSDLYLRVTPETTAIIDGYDFKNQVSTFIDEIDGKPWYEVPFAYDPAWNR